MFGFFERLTEPFPNTPPSQPPSTLWAFCLHYSRAMRLPLVLLAVLAAAVAIAEVVLFGFLGQLVDWLGSKDPDSLWQDEKAALIAYGALVLVGLPLLTLLHSMVNHQSLLGNFPMSIRWLAHRYMLRQSMAFYQDDFAGRIATKVLQTSLAVREAVLKLLGVLVYILVYFVSMLVLVAQADVRLMLPLLVWLLCYIGVLWFFVPRLKKVSAKQADARSLMTGRIVDSYTNIPTVKLFSHSRRETEYARESMEGFLTTVYGQMRLATGLNVSVNVLNYLVIFCMAALSIVLWQDALVSVGSIAVALGLAFRLNGMSHWVMWEISSLFEHIGTVIDGMKTLSKPLDVQDRSEAKPLQVNQGTIAFDSVAFRYSDEQAVFEQLQLAIAAGEKVGVVGRSGAGKSTLVNLLLRFYDVQAGRVSIDGQNIADVTQESLRQHIGMVTQDTSLLHRSVRDNICYGRPDATDAEIITAAKRAEAHDFILTLEDSKGRKGYEAHVGERGVTLSGGQRQRIAIARVLLKDAPILILDEATSALDSEVEASIQASLSTLMEGKTVIAIAHRLSTIAAMDRLVVLDQGRIAEQGTHSELVRQGGIYAQLWAHQSGGFIGED